MHKLVSWLFTIPFLILFSLHLMIFDLVLRFNPSPSCASRTSFLVSWGVLKLFKICGVSFDLEYYENFLDDLKSSEPKVIVANHQSLIDLAILTVMFKELQPRFISKRELAKYLPFVSLQLREGGHCLIDRSDRRQAIKSIIDKTKDLKEFGYALIVFPEGTRARDGKVKVFKPGGLSTMFAKLETCQVYPVAINNSYLLAKHKMMPVPFGLKVSAKALPVITVKMDDNFKDIVKEIEDKITEQVEHEC